MGRTTQKTAAEHIEKLLGERQVTASPRRLNLPDGQQWLVLERNTRQAGVDAASGIWLRESAADDWRCVATPHSTSGAIMAADFLSKE
jgi:hypothetical protein